MPVAQWVEENVLDPLTDGRHRVLRDAARILNSLPLTPPQTPPSTSFALPDTTSASLPPSDTNTNTIDIRRQIDLSLHVYPAASRALETLRTIHAGKIDLPALIRTPDELFHAEDVWAGREYREKRRQEMDEALARDPEKNAAAYLQWAIAEHRLAEASASAGSSGGAGNGAGAGDAGGGEDAATLAYALEVAADEIAKFAGGRGARTAGGELGDSASEGKGKGGGGAQPDGTGADADGDVVMKTEDEDQDGGTARPATAINGRPPEPQVALALEAEDPILKKLRLNLLALAKRAPLDQIMKLPPELVPAHLRHIVPTADA